MNLSTDIMNNPPPETCINRRSARLKITISLISYYKAYNRQSARLTAGACLCILPIKERTRTRTIFLFTGTPNATAAGAVDDPGEHGRQDQQRQGHQRRPAGSMQRLQFFYIGTEKKKLLLILKA